MTPDFTIYRSVRQIHSKGYAEQGNSSPLLAQPCPQDGHNGDGKDERQYGVDGLHGAQISTIQETAK